MPTLPANAPALTISTFDSQLDPSALTCDLEKLQFIDAYGLVGTASALRAALDESPELEVVPPANAKSAAHLANMGFRAFLDERGLSTDLPVRSAAEASGWWSLSEALRAREAIKRSRTSCGSSSETMPILRSSKPSPRESGR